MQCLYVSHGSEFADLEAIDRYCTHNPPSNLTMLLFSDVHGAKPHLKRCYKGINVVKLSHRCCHAVGIYDSVRCQRRFALKKATSFTTQFIELLVACSEKSNGKVFVFNETVNVTSKLDSWVTFTSKSHSVNYSSSSEIVYPDSSVIRCPSILSGSMLNVPVEVYRSASTKVASIADNLPSMKSCTSILDFILHRSLLDAVISMNLNNSDDVKPMRLPFLDMGNIFECSRLVTSPFRYIPTKNKHIQRHAAPDTACKVGMVAPTLDHAVALKLLVEKMAPRASQLNRDISGIHYKVEKWAVIATGST